MSHVIYRYPTADGIAQIKIMFAEFDTGAVQMCTMPTAFIIIHATFL
jgi:hypothetical protein